MAIYLDNNSTTPLAPEALEAMLPVLREHHGNASSKSHSFGWHAEALVEVAREQVANLIGALPEEIIFTSGATESNNLALKGLGDNLQVVTAKTEHRSVLDPLEYLEKKGAILSFLDVDSEGHIISSKPKIDSLSMISLMLANNEIGTLHDIKNIFAGFSCIKHCDATQALGKIDIDVKTFGADLISFSAHKVYGPKGIGALYVKKSCLTKSFSPLLHGGSHEDGLRSGTLNVAGIVGFGKACELAKERFKEDSVHIESLTQKLFSTLKKQIPEIQLNGSSTKRLLGNLNVSIPGLLSGELLSELSTSIALSSSSACQSSIAKPSHVLEALGLEKSRKKEAFRIGIGRYNTESEIDTTASELIKRANRRK